MGGIFDRLRGLGAVLASLALALQILVPSGFMVSSAQGAPVLVVCTGHGPLLATGDGHGQPDKAPASKDHGVCVFASHAAGPAPAPAAAFSVTAFTPTPVPTFRGAEPAPGRGLAAPPPPSQAPPLRSI